MMRSRKLLLFGGVLAATAAIITTVGVFRSSSASANSLGGLSSISAGEGQTCAVTSGGQVMCWGDQGMTGAPSTTGLPVLVPGVDGATQVSAGYTRTCALQTGGSVICWGRNADPTAVTGLNDVVQVDAGNEDACAVTSGGAVKCWGDSQAPTGLQGLESSVVSVDVGIKHSCAVKSSGSVTCWGVNQYGQLGDGTTTNRISPVNVAGIDDAVQVAVALNHTCALSRSGAVSCWGYRYGASPIAVPGLETSVTDLSALYNHTCARTNDGAMKCWGANGYGQLGDGYGCGIACASPTDVFGLSSAVAEIAAGANHSCALLDDGTARCWGNNFIGQLGNGHGGANVVSPLPTTVVVSEAKEDSCPAEGCPMPPSRPVVRNGLDFSIGIDSDGDGIEECGTHDGQPLECVMPLGSEFDVIVSLHSLPPQMEGYGGMDVILDETAFHAEGFEFVWPDCAIPVTARKPAGVNPFTDEPQPPRVAFGCHIGAGGVWSTYTGPVLRTESACLNSGALPMLHSFGNTSLVDQDIHTHYEDADSSEDVFVTCGEKIAGDADCSVHVDSIDAQLMLQREATIIDKVRCEQQVDVNMDNTANAIDAALTLQYAAGLVSSLPVPPPD